MPSSRKRLKLKAVFRYEYTWINSGQPTMGGVEGRAIDAAKSAASISGQWDEVCYAPIIIVRKTKCPDKGKHVSGCYHALVTFHTYDTAPPDSKHLKMSLDGIIERTRDESL